MFIAVLVCQESGDFLPSFEFLCLGEINRHAVGVHYAVDCFLQWSSLSFSDYKSVKGTKVPEGERFLSTSLRHGKMHLSWL